MDLCKTIFTEIIFTFKTTTRRGFGIAFGTGDFSGRSLLYRRQRKRGEREKKKSERTGMRNKNRVEQKNKQKYTKERNKQNNTQTKKTKQHKHTNHV
jgi:hypothetical protein